MLRIESWDRFPDIAFREICGALKLSGQDTFAQRRKGDDVNAKLVSGVDQAILFRIGKPGTVLYLEGVNMGD